MEFGYFTLSDNHYPDNTRTASQLVLQIRDQAIYADQLGMHSAWIGEHHFDSLGVNSCPGTLLASIIGPTERIRLAPAVTVLPLHHPIHVAEEWATIDLISGGRVDFATGRGYDADEYKPFGAPFMDSAGIFEEGLDVLLKAWTEPGEWSHKGKYYDIENMSITPKPVQNPIPVYVGSFSKTSLATAAKRGLNISFAPFAAYLVHGGLDKAVDAYREACVKAGHTPGKAMCSYFVFLADTPLEDDYGRESLLDYFKHCALRSLPSDPAKLPPNLHYYVDICRILENMKKESLSERAILLGPAAKIIEGLKRVEEAGIEEVVFYFNVGNKPHSLVKEQMARFMEEVAPAFEGSHRAIAAE